MNISDRNWKQYIEILERRIDYLEEAVRSIAPHGYFVDKSSVNGRATRKLGKIDAYKEVTSSYK